MSWYIAGVFQDAVSKGVRNISFGDLSGKLGVTMYVVLYFTKFSSSYCGLLHRVPG